MIVALSQVNWLAVVLASVAHFVLGGVWFMGLFGKQYAAALGIADRPPEKPSAIFLVGPFVCSAATIVTSAVLMRALGITTFADALGLGLVVGVGYLVAMTVNIAINPLFPRPLHYAAINAPMFVLGSLMSCAILVGLG
ncbi:DUF1761 domain-containing protein [Sandaracinus amylolyticus]|uniref:DUF1761 domain-containing protein n=1 Tax=Sandaracinus amylolyticus TaxID=927083 RepID=UPI001F442449|nr:DUF1761 domain-containing protein [Sandaracinus amylolyticus]UJR78535.1 Hypothetical protein I5071_5650 [Sandaracinus amylolyticus]